MSGPAHTIGAKDCSNLRTLPSLAPLGVLLRCGSPEEAGADEQAHFPRRQRAASRLPCGFVHRSGSIGELTFIHQLSKKGRNGGRCARWASALSDRLPRVRVWALGITLTLCPSHTQQRQAPFLWMLLLDYWSSLLSTSSSGLTEAVS